MADQQLKDNKIRVFKVRVRQYLRKHYKPSKEEYFAICIYCSTKVGYKSNYAYLPLHLNVKHPEVLTGGQKTERNIHWAWDYFIPTLSGDAQCIICKKLLNSHDPYKLGIHLNVHRKIDKIFDPNEVIYEDTHMYGASTSASGSMIVEEHQEASIPLASNLTDDTDRTCVPNESATKTSEPSEYVANSPLENIENIMDNIKLPTELKPLSDTEEVADREEVLIKKELEKQENF